ncbi:MAG: hypothetical protein WCQ57_08265, partial [Verrucomicrobiota bacterium]
LLAMALAAKPGLLLLDEPTNHMDLDSILWMEEFLLGEKIPLLFVTHDRAFLRRMANRIIELDRRAFSHPGNYTAYLESKAARRQIAEQSERRRQRFLEAELQFVRAGVRAQRSKSRHRLDTFYQIAGQEAPPEEREMDLILPPRAADGKHRGRVGRGRSPRRRRRHGAVAFPRFKPLLKSRRMHRGGRPQWRRENHVAPHLPWRTPAR